jgi:hypothetical protein
MSKNVEVWLDKTSEPITHKAKNTYQKGDLFCVYTTDGKVYKYPISNIFRIVEGYGTHGSETIDKKSYDYGNNDTSCISGINTVDYTEITGV